MNQQLIFKEIIRTRKVIKCPNCGKFMIPKKYRDVNYKSMDNDNSRKVWECDDCVQVYDFDFFDSTNLPEYYKQFIIEK